MAKHTKSKPRGNRKPASKESVGITEKQRKALELRKAGVKLDTIAEQLGYADASGAYRAIISALKKTLQEPADELRKMELERLDNMLFRLEHSIRAGDPVAIRTALAIQDRRAKYLGLDTPQGFEPIGDMKVVLEWSDSNGNGKRGD